MSRPLHPDPVLGSGCSGLGDVGEGEGGWAEEVRTSGEKVRSGGDERDLGDQSFLKTQIGKHILYLNIIVSKCYKKALQILQIAFTYFYISRLTVISVVVKK